MIAAVTAGGIVASIEVSAVTRMILTRTGGGGANLGSFDDFRTGWLVYF